MKRHNRGSLDVRGMIGSLVAIAVGLVTIKAARGFETMGAVFPRAIAIAMIVLALIYLIMAWRGHENPVAAQSGSNWRRVAMFVILLAWALLLERLGFLTTSLICYSAGLLVGNFDRWTAGRVVFYGAIGAVVVVSLFLLFRFGLNVTFPTGILI